MDEEKAMSLDKAIYAAGKRGVQINLSTPQERAVYEAGKRGMAITFGGASQPAADQQPGLMERAAHTVRDVADDTAQNLQAAASSEGRMEHPDMPELSQIPMGDDGVGFWESLPVNLKMGLTMDPMEKANIVSSHFEGDPRLGGVYQDKNGNPILEWNGQPYYVNKPGPSRQDATDLVAMTAQMMPAARVAGGATTALGRLGAGAAAYGATDIAQQYGTVAAGGKENVDLGQAGTVGGVGGAIEAALPPVMKGMAKVGGTVMRGAEKAAPATTAAIKGTVQRAGHVASNLPYYTGKTVGRALNAAPEPRGLPHSAISPNPAPSAASAAMGTQGANTGVIPLTQGQRSGDIAKISREEAMRQGGYGDAARGIMRNFDDTQRGAIQSEAETLQKGLGAGTGFEGPNLTDIGARLQGDLIGAQKTAKAGVSAAYDAAAKMDARLTVKSLTGLNKAVRESLQGMPIDKELTPAAVRALQEVGSLTQAQMKAPGNISALTLQRLETTRRKLGHYIGTSKNPTDKRAVTTIKARLDDWLDEAVENSLFTGDEGALAALKEARALRRDFALKFESGRTASGAKDPAGNAMVKILDEKQATPEQVVNFITGYGRITSDAKSLGLVRRMKDVFGPESEQVKLLKDAYLARAFTKELQGERQVTGPAIAKGATEFLQGPGRTLAKELFTPAERRAIGNFVGEVRKTITPPDARNPSRTTWALMGMLRDHNLLSMSGKTMKSLPLGGEVGSAVESVGGGISARNATSQLERLTSRPLVESGVAATAIKTHGATQEAAKRRATAQNGPRTFAPALGLVGGNGPAPRKPVAQDAPPTISDILMRSK